MDVAKEKIQRVVESLPDDATLKDIQYRIYVRQAIAAGLRDVQEGRVVSQEDVERRMARWTETREQSRSTKTRRYENSSFESTVSSTSWRRSALRY